MTSTGLPLKLSAVSKRYEQVTALRPTDLTVDAGEFVTLLGPSGSGKTTLLSLVAGYAEPTSGQVRLGERDITRLPARHRNIGMVFQSYALFPHMTVGQNVAYGLKVRGRPKREIGRRVDEALAIVRLSGLAERSVRKLSGGQQQRVALARALAIEPDLVLMDEPLGALDRQLRKSVQLELRRLHDAHRRTTIYVTHDQEEALVLSDRIVVMRDGGVEQIGTASELYDRPANAFVAGFIGESNLLSGRVRSTASDCAEIDVPGLGCTVNAGASGGVAAGDEGSLLIRPEHLELRSDGGIPGVVEETVFLGELQSVSVRLETGERLWLRRLAAPTLPAGESIRIGWQPERLRILAPA